MRTYLTQLLVMAVAAVMMATGVSAQAFVPLNPGTSPTPNSRSVLRTSNVAANFTVPMNSPTSAQFVVHGSMTGRRTGLITGGGTTTLTFNPVADFRPGERVHVSLTGAMSGTNTLPLSPDYGYEFFASAGAGPAEFGGNPRLFGPTTNSTAGVAAGDMDGDGDIDIVVGGVNATNAIWFNDGAGNFTAGPIFGGSNATAVIVLVDVDGDGDLDVIEGNYGNHDFMYFNTGGILGPPIQLPNPAGVSFTNTNMIKAADFDGDGDMDLVRILWTDVPTSPQQSHVFLNNGAGVFTIGASVGPTGAKAACCAVGDFNGDGAPDIVLGRQSTLVGIGETSVLINNGTGASFGALAATIGPTASITTGIAAFDADGDGDLDVVIVRGSGQQDQVYLNDGTGGFTAGATIGGLVSSNAVDVADFNGDGIIDIAVAGNGVQSRMYLGSTGAAFTAAARDFGGATIVTKGLTVADFNGDGFVDIAATYFNSNPIVQPRVFLNLLPTAAIGFAPTSYSVNESQASVTLTVTRLGATSTSVTVNYATSSGTATGGSDFTTTSGTLTFGIGITSQTIVVPILNDGVNEGVIDETFAVILSNPSAGNTLGATTATVNIVDDDVPPTVAFASSTMSTPEALPTPAAQATVQLNRLYSQPVQVTFDTANGTATTPGDYTAAVAQTMTIPAGSQSGTANVVILDDLLVEGPEDFTITLSAPTSGATLGLITTTTVTIDDDDTLPQIRFTQTGFTVGEGGGTVIVNVELTRVHSLPITVDWATVANLTATGAAASGIGVDFIMASGTLTFLANSLTPTVQPIITIEQDTLSEANETFTVALSNPNAQGALGTPSVTTVTINDDDPLPVVSIVPTSVSITVAENAAAGLANVDVQLSVISGQTVTVVVNFAGGTATAGSDFTATPVTLTFAPGVTLQTAAVAILNDTLDENDETIVATLGSPVACVLSPVTITSTINITDDDPPPTVGFAAASTAVNVGEAAGTVTLTVNLSAQSGKTIVIDYTTQASIALNAASPGADFTAASGSLTFNPGETAKTIVVTIINDLNVEVDEVFEVAIAVATGSTANATPATMLAVVTIQDNDSIGVIAFQSATYTVAENAIPATATITLSLTAPSPGTVSVGYRTVAGGNPAATPGVDYSSVQSSVFFPLNATTATFTVAIINDTLDEDDEQIALELFSPQNATLSTTAFTATLTITDDDLPPTIILPTGPIMIPEAAGTAQFNVTLSTASGRSITVNWQTVNGVAIGGVASGPGVDFISASGQLTFPPNSTSQSVTVTIVDDAVAEPDEPFAVSLSNAINANPPVPASVTLTIQDNDSIPTFSLSSTTYTFTEATGNAQITVNLSIAPTQNVTADFSAQAGTATAITDFTPVNTTLTFTPTGSLSQTVNVPVIGDTIHELDETVLLALANPTGGAALGTPIAATLTITDNDPVPSVEFPSSNTSVSEGVGQATVTVMLSGPSGLPVTVNYATSNGSAVAPGDYTPSSGTLTFNPSETSKSFTVTIIDDTAQEGPENIFLQLSSPSGATLGAQAIANLTILDNDTSAQLAFSQASTSVTEDLAGTVNLTVQLSSPIGTPVTADVSVTGGTATSGTDFTLLTTSITVPANQPSAVVQIAIVADTTNEPNETLVLTLSNVVGATLGTQSTTTLNITDDDPAVTVSFASATQSFSEAAGAVPVTVSLSQPTTYPVTVLVTSANVTATAPADYAAIVSQLVTIPANQTSATVTLTISSDALDENDETLTLTLSSPTPASATIGTTPTTTITILDDDLPPAIAFASATLSVAESAFNAILPVQLSAVSGRNVMVTWALSAGGTATSGTDFTAPGGQVTIVAGLSSGEILIPVTDDALFEGPETFVIALSSPSNATLGATSTITVTITDNDPQPVLAFSQPAFEVIEGTPPGSTTATITVSRIGDAEDPVSVSYATANGTATSGTDYFAASGQLTFAPGVFSQSFSVTIIPNAVSDGDRTFTASISNPANAALGTPTSVVVTIRDDEGTPTVSFSAPTVTVQETAGTVTLTVNLLFASTQVVTVDYATSNGTATAPGDYASTTGSLTFPTGTTSQTIVVGIVDDLAVEGDETFTVTLLSPVGANLGTNTTSTVTIQSDDLLPSLNFTAATATVSESAGSHTITVQLSTAAAQTVTVNYASANGTATAPIDFTAISGTLSFAPGTTTRTIQVPITDDGSPESSESFTVTLSNPTNAAIATPSTITVSITDDDTAAPVLPIFQSLSVSRTSRTYTAGESITVIAQMNSPALTLSTNLSAVDTAFTLPRAFQSFGGGEFRMTSLGLNPLTMVQGINLPITVTASDFSGNSVTSTVLVNIDNTPAQGILTFNAPIQAVPAGVLRITLAFNELIQTTPTISISGIPSIAVSSAAMLGTPPAHSFTYAWTVPSGTSGQATVTVNGAVDMAGLTAVLPAGVQLTVTGGAPVLLADAGPDLNPTTIDLVTLDATASIGASTYAWDVIAQPFGVTTTLNAEATARPTFTPTAGGTYVFRLTVTNGALTAQDIVQVFAPDLPPVVDAGNDFSLDHTDVITGAPNNRAALGLDGRVFDPNGETVWTEWRVLSTPPGGNILPVDATSSTTDLRVYGSRMVGGIYEFELRAADATRLNANQWIAATVRLLVISDTVIPPAADAGLAQVVQSGRLVVLDGTNSSDPDATNPLAPQLSFAWTVTARPEGAIVSLAGANTATPGFTPTVPGIYVFSLRVTDPAGYSSSPSTVRIIVIDTQSSPAVHLPVVEIVPPTATPVIGTQITLNTTVNFALLIDSVSVRWQQLQGPATVPTPDGRSLTFTPALPGSYRFRATPHAIGRDGVADEIEVSVAGLGLAGPNAVATIVSVDDPDGDGYILFIPNVGVDNIGSNARINVSAAASTTTGIVAPKFRWRQVSGPTVGIAGVATAEASIAPRVAGVYVLEVEVTDGAGLSDTARVTFAVDTYDPLANPTLGNSLARPTVTQPAPITLTAQATLTGSVFDPNDPTPGYRWVQLSGVPVIFDTPIAPTTTLLPPVAGVYRFALHGVDGKNRGPGAVVTLTVNQPTVTPPAGGGGGGGGCLFTASSSESSKNWVLPMLGLLTLAAAGSLRRRRTR